MARTPVTLQQVPFSLCGLDHLVLRVRDLEAMKHFYIDLLGCTLERSLDDLGLYQLRAGSTLIDLVTLDGQLGRMGGKGPGAEGRNLDHFCLRVAPFDPQAIHEWLARHGVACGDVARRYGADGFGPSIYLRDPEGNTVELKGPPEAVAAPATAS